MRTDVHPLVELAKKSIVEFVTYSQVTPPPSILSDEMNFPAGTFVSIKKKGRLRGCIGTFSPTQLNIAQEVIQNAISAATKDPRFSPVTPLELDELEISVDVLSMPEGVENLDVLDPSRYGIIVKSGFKRGLLLPDLEGVDTVEDQIFITRQKAGISDEEPIEIERFEVKRYR